MSEFDSIHSKKPEPPSTVTCLECGGDYNFLPPHLRTHELTSIGYRAKYGLPEDSPIYSARYSQILSSKALRHPQIDITRALSQSVKQRRAQVVELLATEGYFTPRQASRYTEIPLSTLQSAILKKRVPYGIASLLIPNATTHRYSRGQVVRIISLPDLLSFAANHRSRK